MYYAFCHYADVHYAECRYAECRVALRHCVNERFLKTKGKSLGYEG
jgi:hypothetical protein